MLYHLEDPLLAIRHLRALTEKCLLLESMCVPDEKPSMLLREEPREDDQSLTDVAYYPSEDSLIKMLYRAGFAFADAWKNTCASTTAAMSALNVAPWGANPGPRIFIWWMAPAIGATVCARPSLLNPLTNCASKCGRLTTCCRTWGFPPSIS